MSPKVEVTERQGWFGEKHKLIKEKLKDLQINMRDKGNDVAMKLVDGSQKIRDFCTNIKIRVMSKFSDGNDPRIYLPLVSTGTGIHFSAEANFELYLKNSIDEHGYLPPGFGKLIMQTSTDSIGNFEEYYADSYEILISKIPEGFIYNKNDDQTVLREYIVLRFNQQIGNSVKTFEKKRRRKK